MNKRTFFVPTRMLLPSLSSPLTCFRFFLCSISSRCLPLLETFRSALRALPQTLPPPPSSPAAAPVRCCMHPLFCLFSFFSPLLWFEQHWVLRSVRSLSSIALTFLPTFSFNFFSADGTASSSTTGATLAVQDGSSTVPLLPLADRTRLKSQSFVRPERSVH